MKFECPICHCLQVMSMIKVFSTDDADDDNDNRAMTIATRTLSLGSLKLDQLDEKTTREIKINLRALYGFLYAYVDKSVRA